MSMSNYFIGLMSGTSMDSIDAVLVSFKPSLNVLATQNQPIAVATLKQYRKLVNASSITIPELAELEQKITHDFIHATQSLLEKSKLNPQQITAIGCHGQTLWHQPKGKHPFSWQLLDPNQLTEKTQITTINDFRRRDIAAGGQGAPLPQDFTKHFSAVKRKIASFSILEVLPMLPI